LTDEWEVRGVKKGQEYAILTYEITKAWAGITTKRKLQQQNCQRKRNQEHLMKIK
jgi:hypothetical protein